MKAEDYVTKWCDETYKGGKELGDWTTAEVMKFANDFSNEKLRLLAVSIALENKRKAFCIWYYAQSQPLDANKVFDWFSNEC